MRTLPGDTLECEIDMQDENQSILSISDDMASLYEEDMLHTASAKPVIAPEGSYIPEPLEALEQLAFLWSS